MLDTTPAIAPHKVDVSRGEMRGEVSAQWASRPDDQKFLSLSELRDRCRHWADESTTYEIDPRAIEVGVGETENDLIIRLDGHMDLSDMTHWGFGQLCTTARVPANYARSLPASLASVNLLYGLQNTDTNAISAYVRQNGTTELRAITSPKYGRIFDYDVVDRVMNVAGDGVGDTHWKVPGVMNWGNGTYNPNVDITKDTTTLYASDRDVFVFLVDDLNPIEVGKLANGDPDLMFRGFYVWNSEVGARTAGIATMYLRAVCQNRCLWGVEGFEQMILRHTQNAPDAFIEEAMPTLETFAETRTDRLIAGVKAAKGQIVAQDEEERIDFLGRFGFSAKQAKKLITRSEEEEFRAPESVWDFAQAITATARDVTHQDQRIKMEQVAQRMLDKVHVPA